MVKLVGIAGASGAGKTTVIRKLVQKHHGKISVIKLDDYFKNKNDLPPSVDWEQPEALDFSQLISDLKNLKAGRNVRVPVYKRRLLRRLKKTRLVKPRPIVIVEGFLILVEPRLRALLDQKIFFDLPEEKIVERRLARGTIPGVDEKYIRSKVIEGHRRNILPTKDHADRVVDGQKPVAQVVKILEKELGL